MWGIMYDASVSIGDRIITVCVVSFNGPGTVSRSVIFHYDRASVNVVKGVREMLELLKLFEIRSAYDVYRTTKKCNYGVILENGCVSPEKFRAWSIGCRTQ